MVNYFSKTYGEARWLFKEAALDLSKKYKYAEYRTIRIPSRTDQDLTIDTFYLPAQSKPEKIIIVCSGVHGVEGMTGSAVELLCMKEDIVTSRMNKSATGILFIHAVNPYGQKYHRRVTENNIDLGRNFIPGDGAFSPLEQKIEDGYISYAALNAYLNPRKKYSQGLISWIGFRVRTMSLLARTQLSQLRQRILEGQYQFEKGIFFGGTHNEPQVKILGDLLSEYLAKYKRVLAIDLHTGYGAPGKLHFFLPYARKADDAFENIFEGYPIECNKQGASYKDSYEVKGSFLEFVEHLSKGKTYIPMVFKFGTIDNRKLSSQVASLERIIDENECFQFGYKTEKDKKIIQKAFRETYFPENELWRQQAIEETKDTLPKIVERFQQL